MKLKADDSTFSILDSCSSPIRHGQTTSSLKLQNWFTLYRKDIRARFTREGNAISAAESSRIAAEKAAAQYKCEIPEIVNLFIQLAEAARGFTGKLTVRMSAIQTCQTCQEDLTCTRLVER
ncbi:4241_t:CDS:2 [Paraglomus occultum]|uniref:4241_t:CDS:1 n=1 Tax=Paraglomus occultum TaxID=144539 RepID=A0A9N8ZFK5_9GLOM|nr:4241_t:CDS:2 [Paraglomus occultum]